MDMQDLAVVSFNDEQKSAVGRALMAVAEETFERTKTEPIAFQQEEVIELLSDSDYDVDNEPAIDCEEFGEICTDLEYTQENIKSYTNPSNDLLSKTQTKQQCDDQGSLQINNNDREVAGVCFSADNTILDNEATTTDNVNAKNIEICVNPGTFTFYQHDDIKTTSNDIETIELDDDDYDPYDNNNDIETTEEKDKKFIDLMETDSDDDHQPTSASITNRSNHNLEAFLIYICPQCGVFCDNIKKWKAHTDIVHNLRSISQLDMKMIINRLGQSRYQCNSCHAGFAIGCRYGLLLTHRIKHMANPNFLKCRLCDVAFPSRRYVLIHFRKHHKKITLGKIRRTEYIRRHICFMCPVCNQKLRNFKGWSDHLEGQHSWYSILPETVTPFRDNLVECKTCAKIFREVQTKCHALRHGKYIPFHCTICNSYSTADINLAVEHVRGRHLKEKTDRSRHGCSYCDKRFSSPTARNAHTNEQHTIELLTCEVCKKKFVTSSRLLTHMFKMNHQKMK